MSNDNNDRRESRSGGGRRRYFSRPRVCQFCSDPSIKIHYKDISLLSGFINREGKIRPRRQTGTCAKHQRKIAVAVKQARHMALLQFSGEALN
jgi:small subunit ribosomal protein S18